MESRKKDYVHMVMKKLLCADNIHIKVMKTKTNGWDKISIVSMTVKLDLGIFQYLMENLSK